MMINVNLLPPELRKKERTPIVIFLPMIIGLICVLSAGAVTAYVHFAKLTEAENDRRRLEGELNQRKAGLKYEEKLLAEEQEYKKRAETIQTIAASRMLMTKKLDLLMDVVTSGDKDTSFFVWLSDLKTVPPKAQAGIRGRSVEAVKPGGDLSIKGFALADKDPLQNYNRFHAAVKSSDFFKECMSLENPDGKIHEFTDEKTPRKAWTIDLQLAMMHPTEVAKANAKARGVTEKQVAVQPSKTKGAPR